MSEESNPLKPATKKLVPARLVLLVDIGNTRIKWQLSKVDPTVVPEFDDSTADAFSAIAHAEKTKKDLLQELSAQWWALAEKPEQVYIANVSNDGLVADLEAICFELFSVQPEVVKSAEKSQHITNGYLFAHRLGVDRWLGMLAANVRYPRRNVIVISSGSAVTVDALQADGKHLGGVIFPGIRLQQNSLFNETANLAILAKLNADESTKERTVWADHTKAAISGGTVYAVTGGVEKIIATMHLGFSESVSDDSAVATPASAVCIFTGGDAEQVMQHMNWQHLAGIEKQHCPNLVFEGLRIMATEKMAVDLAESSAAAESN